MRGVSILFQYVTQARVSFEDYTTRLALCSMGFRYGRPFENRQKQFHHVLVAVDKFTKWIEAKPIKNLDSSTAISFIRELVF